MDWRQGTPTSGSLSLFFCQKSHVSGLPLFLKGPAMILTCLSLLFAEVLSLWMVPPSHKLIYNPHELQRYHEISTLSINNHRWQSSTSLAIVWGPFLEASKVFSYIMYAFAIVVTLPTLRSTMREKASLPLGKKLKKADSQSWPKSSREILGKVRVPWTSS